MYIYICVLKHISYNLKHTQYILNIGNIPYVFNP